MLPEMTPQLALVGMLAAMAAGTAVGVVMLRDPIRSALSLVANFFVLAFLYFTLSAEMLGIVQVVVYTGAIMVLFLFVIMLLNLGYGGAGWKEQPGTLKLFLGFAFGFALFGLVASQVVGPIHELNPMAVAPEGFGSPQALGRSLFTSYVWPFEVASVLLLLGIVGAILLAKRRI